MRNVKLKHYIISIPLLQVITDVFFIKIVLITTVNTTVQTIFKLCQQAFLKISSRSFFDGLYFFFNIILKKIRQYVVHTQPGTVEGIFSFYKLFWLPFSIWVAMLNMCMHPVACVYFTPLYWLGCFCSHMYFQKWVLDMFAN